MTLLPLTNSLIPYLNGMCLFFVPSASITSPKEERLLLMYLASFNLSPLASVLLTRSLPARSMRKSLPTHESTHSIHGSIGFNTVLSFDDESMCRFGNWPIHWSLESPTLTPFTLIQILMWERELDSFELVVPLVLHIHTKRLSMMNDGTSYHMKSKSKKL